MSLRCVFQGSCEEPREYIDNAFRCAECGAELDPDEDPGINWEVSEHDYEFRAAGMTAIPTIATTSTWSGRRSRGG